MDGAAVEALLALYPLYRFFVSENPLADPYFTETEPDPEEVDPPPTYPLSQLVEDTYLPEELFLELEELLQEKPQAIFYGPPGTGKTYVAKRFAKYLTAKTGGQIRTVQFHPSYAYEEFIEGIRPQSGDDGGLRYPVEAGLFVQFCEVARANSEQSHVLIVDEINRGNLPRIFGELMLLLEYRGEGDKVMLPYSKKPFSIPRNLFILGTMNTADRSIAMVDHALRRRFHFLDLRPSVDVLRQSLATAGQEEMLWLADLLERLNQQLEEDGVEWHLHVGHSHFMVPGIDEVRAERIWRYSILPTLQEYFYNAPDRLKRYDFETMALAARNLQ